MICDPYSIDGLHKMAQDLGVKRCWFHKDHYDMPLTRIGELTARCELVSSKEIARIMGRDKKHGYNPARRS